MQKIFSHEYVVLIIVLKFSVRLLIADVKWVRFSYVFVL